MLLRRRIWATQRRLSVRRYKQVDRTISKSV